MIIWTLLKLYKKYQIFQHSKTVILSDPSKKTAGIFVLIISQLKMAQDEEMLNTRCLTMMVNGSKRPQSAWNFLKTLSLLWGKLPCWTFHKRIPHPITKQLQLLRAHCPSGWQISLQIWLILTIKACTESVTHLCIRGQPQRWWGGCRAHTAGQWPPSGPNHFYTWCTQCLPEFLQHKTDQCNTVIRKSS